MHIGNIQGKRGVEINIDEHTLYKKAVSDMLQRAEADFPNARGKFEFRMKERGGHSYLQLTEQTWFGKFKEKLSIGKETRFSERADALVTLNQTLNKQLFTSEFSRLRNDAMTGQQARDMAGIARIVSRDEKDQTRLVTNKALAKHMDDGQFLLRMHDKYAALHSKSSQVKAAHLQSRQPNPDDDLSAVDLDALSDAHSMIDGDDFLNDEIIFETGNGDIDGFSNRLSGIERRDSFNESEVLSASQPDNDVRAAFEDEGLSSPDVQKGAFAERLEEMRELLEYSPDFFQSKIEQASAKMGGGDVPILSADDLATLPEALDRLLKGEPVSADLQCKLLLINEAGGSIKRLLASFEE